MCRLIQRAEIKGAGAEDSVSEEEDGDVSDYIIQLQMSRMSSRSSSNPAARRSVRKWLYDKAHGNNTESGAKDGADQADNSVGLWWQRAATRILKVVNAIAVGNDKKHEVSAFGANREIPPDFAEQCLAMRRFLTVGMAPGIDIKILCTYFKQARDNARKAERSSRWRPRVFVSAPEMPEVERCLNFLESKRSGCRFITSKGAGG